MKKKNSNYNNINNNNNGNNNNNKSRIDLQSHALWKQKQEERPFSLMIDWFIVR